MFRNLDLLRRALSTFAFGVGFGVAIGLGVVVAPSAKATPNALNEPAVDRPPQFVLLAFDGSYNHEFWESSRAFAREMNQQGRPLHFTYFISGVYYLEGRYKNLYVAPGHGAGKSAIGWGEDTEDAMLARYDETNRAFLEGHEIASHANCHFDGGRWSLAQWENEFAQFDHILANFFEINRLKPTVEFPDGWVFPASEITGFRAPLLAANEGLRKVLKSHHYRYDTSNTATTDYWPEVDPVSGAWNFPLAMLKIAGTGKRTLSMDYNFYVAQSRARPDVKHESLYEEQMVETYLRYFQANYNGNRAPVHIGHHFAQWNGGAYWNAMKRVATEVCGLPEVRCVTYTELANYLDAQGVQRLAAYRKGSFAKVTPVKVARDDSRLIEAELNLDLSTDLIEAKVVGRDAAKFAASGRDGSLRYFINEHAVDSAHFTLSNARKETPVGATASLGARLWHGNLEVLSKTYKVEKAGTPDERIAEQADEDRALLGDLPEAHLDEVREANAHAATR